MAATRFNDLAAMIDDLEAAGRLSRVRSDVDPRHELAGIAHALEGGPRAVLFEKVKGQRWPVLAGLYWHRGLLADLFRRDEAALARHLVDGIARWRAAPAEPVVVTTGPVLEVTEKDVDLGKIPAPVHALTDPGPCFDAAVAIAKDPETGARDATIQRFQVTGRDTLAVGIAGRQLGAYLEKARRLGRSLWITLNCGVGPGLFIAAAAPAEAAPVDRDALSLAGVIGGAPLALVPGMESDVEMAAEAMWALECEIVPGEAAEGPLLGSGGGIAPAAAGAAVHVRRVHRRERPVFQTALAGSEVSNAAALIGEAQVLALLQCQVPGVGGVHFTPGAGGCRHAVVQIATRHAGWSKHAIIAAFAAYPPLGMVTVVDDDVDIRKAEDVAWALATRLDAATGVVRIDNAARLGLDAAFPGSVGTKLGFDATRPVPRRGEHERAAFKAVALEKHMIAEPPLRAAPRPAQAATPAPDRDAAAPPPRPPVAASGRSGEYDADRIWQRELDEWKKGGADDAAAAVKPATSTDWDESRWLKRELDAMKREGAGAAVPAAEPAAANSPQSAAIQAAPPAVPDAAAAARKSDDWDEDRWWKRELEAMQRERSAKPAPAAKPPAPAAPKAPARAAPPPARAAAPAKPEPMRAAEHPADDDEGSFFRSGTA